MIVVSNAICSSIFHRIRSVFLHWRRSIFFLILFLICLSLLSVSSIPYYSVYCNNQFQYGLIEANRRNLWNVKEGVLDRFIPILMPVCDRPHYLKRVLDGLIKVEGINETILIVSQDCSQSKITNLITSLPASIRTLILPHTPPFYSLPGYVHNNEYATSANIKFLLEFAFEHMLANCAILLESDLIPSVDFYRYHQWTYAHILQANHSNVISIHAFNLQSTNTSDRYKLFPRGFDSWGWSTARTRWNWLKTHWTKYNNWDIIISKQSKQDQWISLLPKLSRTRMIGLKGINVNVQNEFQQKQFEEGMYMSDQHINYSGIEPIILSSEFQ